MALTVPDRVTIWEVGPRDGLQNEAAGVPTDAKVALVDALSDTGLRHIEVTAFVSPKAIPQLADAEEVCKRIRRVPGVTYGALVPNVKGYERATDGAGLRDIAVFLSASETHNRRNIGCSVAEALERYREVCALAARDGVRVRGYVSTAFGCPYEGDVPQARVVSVARDLHRLGCSEISLGDTIGIGYPAQVARTVEALARHIGIENVALHLHDTYGRGLANGLAGLEAGVTTLDASVGGLGGCPYAPGATGNVATDELVAMLHGMGIETGIDLDVLCRAAVAAGRAVGHEPPSRYLKAALATEARTATGG